MYKYRKYLPTESHANGSDNVSVIDTDTQKVLATIPVGEYPDGVAITSDGSQAYVTNWGSGNVSVIDTATQKMVDTISVRKNPYTISIASIPP
jgi:YVTN family beta-propeller protein